MSDGNSVQDPSLQDSSPQSAPDGAVTIQARKGKAGRPVDPNSKLVRAKALYAVLASQGKNRREILVQLQQTLALTEGSAGVYYCAGKNAFNEPVTA